MVYVTDVRAAGDKVKGIVIPADINASTEYPIAALTKAAERAPAPPRSSPTCCRPTAQSVLDGRRVREALSLRG